MEPRPCQSERLRLPSSPPPFARAPALHLLNLRRDGRGDTIVRQRGSTERHAVSRSVESPATRLGGSRVKGLEVQAVQLRSFTRSERASKGGFFAFFLQNKPFHRAHFHGEKPEFWGCKTCFLMNNRQSFGPKHCRLRQLLTLNTTSSESPGTGAEGPKFLTCVLNVLTLNTLFSTFFQKEKMERKAKMEKKRKYFGTGQKR